MQATELDLHSMYLFTQCCVSMNAGLFWRRVPTGIKHKLAQFASIHGD